AGALPKPLHKVAHIVEPTGKTDRCDTVIRCFQLPHGLSDPIAVQITLRALPCDLLKAPETLCPADMHLCCYILHRDIFAVVFLYKLQNLPGSLLIDDL